MGLPQSGPFLFRSGGGGGTSSGAAGINYLSAIYAGDTLTNINQYDDGASSSPTNGTGGSPTGLTTALNTSTPLVGTSCVRFSKDAANRQGMGWSYDFTVDDISSDRSTPLYFQMYYRTSANYASSDVRGFLYDVTNGTLLSLNDISNGSGNIIAAPGDSQITWVGFTVTAATSYRLIWHIASTNASAWDLDLDCFVCSPQGVVPGAIVADYGTQAWTDSWANATTSVKLTRLGSLIVANGTVTVTGAGATNFDITIPTDYAPASNYTFATSEPIYVGLANLYDAAPGSTPGWIGLISSTTLRVYYSNSGNLGGLTSTAPFTWASGDKITFQASWIVSGWAASAALSTTETLFRTQQAIVSGDVPSTTSGNIMVFPTRTYDPYSSYSTSTGRFTVLRPGTLKVSGVAQQTGGGVAALFLYVNGSIGPAVAGFNAANDVVNINGGVRVNAGDLVDIRPNATVDLTSVSYVVFDFTPDLSIFSTYGTFELLTATSSVKTPGATNNYHQLTGNSLTLTPGTWRLKGTGRWANSGSTPTYSIGGGGWFSANGADSSSVPTALSSASGLTILSVGAADWYPSISPTTGLDADFPTVIVRVTQPVTVYLVSYATMTTAANARVTVYANAERLQ